jgi:pentatricopeptide repeat protein
LSALPDRLQAALGDAYRIERELGGGGMSRVFLADETRLGRKVVIKVLPPEMTAEVNQERFTREIQLAAQLQHPHVVSLLTAAAEGELLYYVMPYIEGESLRAKLEREGELPVGEAVRILKEVVDALAYAHRNGVVHRDIKPDNVLLSEGHAVVTDFGVAKAVTASSGSSSLTSLGVALGTPAYMAPEQAAADPHTDHRADIYAVGALAYEMLAGQPPFTAPTPQAVMAQHVSEPATPVMKRRPAVNEVLNNVVMRCLEKRAADRWQSAADLVPQLEALTTPSGGVTPTGTQPVESASGETTVRQNHPVRVAALFGIAAAVVLGLSYAVMIQLGLPDWVFVGAVALMAIGLPIILVTGHHERQRAIAHTTGLAAATPPGGIRRLFTWRRAILGGGLAFAGLGVVAAGYMGMRVLGIGPVGTLLAAGVLEKQARVILADFSNRTADTTLGPSVTDAFRVDLAQSRVVRLVDASVIGEVLRRMERDPSTLLDVTLGREIAEREGITAVVSGEIGPVGQGYVLSANVLSAVDGMVLAAVRETAADDAGIIPAIDRLSGKLRERIGESLKDIRANEPLERVTTGSFDALKKYSQALRAEEGGEIPRALTLLREATGLDSTFAMAYRKLAVILQNVGAARSEVMAATTKAFDNRDRLPEVERYLTMARYYGSVEYDRARVMDAYRSVLAIDPDETTSLNNLAVELNSLRRYAEAEPLVEHASEVASHYVYSYNAVEAQFAQGKDAEAEATIERFAASDPESPYLLNMRADLAAAQHDFVVAERDFQAMLDARLGLYFQSVGTLGLSGIKGLQGQLAEAESYLARNMEIEAERGIPANYLVAAARRAELEIRLRNQPAAGVRALERALARYPLADMPPSDRPYTAIIRAYAQAGRTERARQLLREYEQEVDEQIRRSQLDRHGAMAEVFLAENWAAEAIAEFRAWHDAGDGFCHSCALHRLGAAFERAGFPDSAIASYEAAATSRHLYPHFQEPSVIAPTYKRLGELYEERGNAERAIEYYNHFVDLWQHADQELQPLVEEVRGRLARLVGENEGEPVRVP